MQAIRKTDMIIDFIDYIIKEKCILYDFVNVYKFTLSFELFYSLKWRTYVYPRIYQI